MYSLPTAIFIAALMTAQEKTPRPVVLPEIAPPPRVVIVPISQPLPVARPMPKETTSFAVHNSTVYLKIGDVVVPMIGTTGCFTPKELLKGDDPRLLFVMEATPPPPPPPNR